jgi:hypothetical protein
VGGVGVVTDYRVDVVSVADPDHPLHIEYLEAGDGDQAYRLAERIVVERGSNPDLHYGDLWVLIEGTNQAEFYCTVDHPGQVPA